GQIIMVLRGEQVRTCDKEALLTIGTLDGDGIPPPIICREPGTIQIQEKQPLFCTRGNPMVVLQQVVMEQRYLRIIQEQLSIKNTGTRNCIQILKCGRTPGR